MSHLFFGKGHVFRSCSSMLLYDVIVKTVHSRHRNVPLLRHIHIASHSVQPIALSVKYQFF